MGRSCECSAPTDADTTALLPQKLLDNTEAPRVLRRPDAGGIRGAGGGLMAAFRQETETKNRRISHFEMTCLGFQV